MKDDAANTLQTNAGKIMGGCTGKGFLPGTSGNPSGKRKGHHSLTAALKRHLTRSDAKAIAMKLISMARAGDLAAIKLTFERLDGVDIEDRLGGLETLVYEKS